jgi:hypothetical protein
MDLKRQHCNLDLRELLLHLLMVQLLFQDHRLFLKFQSANPGGSGVYVDNSAYSFIQQQYVYHGGQLLEFINQYGQLANFLLDCTLSRSQKAGLSAMIGTNPYTNIVVNALSAGVVNYGGRSTTAGVCQTKGDRTGLSMTTTTAIATSPVYNFCLPIMSGVIGANSPYRKLIFLFKNR